MKINASQTLTFWPLEIEAFPLSAFFIMTGAVCFIKAGRVYITIQKCAVWGSRGSSRSPARKETCLLTLMSPINKSVTDIVLSGVVFLEVNGLKGKSGKWFVRLKNLSAY